VEAALRSIRDKTRTIGLSSLGPNLSASLRSILFPPGDMSETRKYVMRAMSRKARQNDAMRIVGFGRAQRKAKSDSRIGKCFELISKNHKN
jgi:hypothetical protein